MTLSGLGGGGLEAAVDDVITTRLTSAFSAAPNTRSAPSRAGMIKSLAFVYELLPSGEATCQT